MTRRERQGTAGKRLHIFRRDGYRCVYCGIPYVGDELTIDHVEPRVKGGDNSEGNIVTCCRPCNEAKGGEAAWSFLSRSPEKRANFLAQASSVWPRLRRAVKEAAR